MKKQHTLGPWVMDIEKLTTGHWNYKIVTEIKPLGNYPLHICTLNKFKDETHLKNAHLIAAAPEMFEALDAALKELERCKAYFFKTRDFGVSELTLAIIENAINKAKGE